MTSEPNPAAVASTAWRGFTASERGAAHIAGGQPNQDAVGAEPLGDDGFIAVVADGHGHSRHIRSARGSRIAVEIAIEAGRELAALVRERPGGKDATKVVTPSGPQADRPSLPSRLKAAARETTVPRLVERWRERVLADVAADPFTESEGGQRRHGDDPTIAYGSTLLLAVAVGHALLIAQIGDGDVVGVRADGGAMLPVPADPQLDGMVTTSLCSVNATADFRLAAFDVAEQPLLAVLMATDGYGNAQLADPWPSAFSRDLAQLLTVHDEHWLAGQLPVWAAMCASAEGSADDTTVALLLTPRSARVAAGAASALAASLGDDEPTLPSGYYVQTIPSAPIPAGLPGSAAAPPAAAPPEAGQSTVDFHHPDDTRRRGAQ